MSAGPTMALIEREAALEICEKEYQERLRMLDYCGDTVAWNIGNAIKGIPTIDAAPVVHGQWEECDDDVNAWIRCPECGFEQDIDYFGDHRHEIEDYKLCPSCGARMDGGEEHEAD